MYLYVVFISEVNKKGKMNLSGNSSDIGGWEPNITQQKHLNLDDLENDLQMETEGVNLEWLGPVGTWLDVVVIFGALSLLVFVGVARILRRIRSLAATCDESTEEGCETVNEIHMHMHMASSADDQNSN